MTVASVELDDLYENAWHSVAKPPRRRSGTAFSRFVLPTARLPFVARNELAIATKSIASVLSPATRSPWVPSNLCRGGTEMGKTPEERGKFNLEYTTITLVEKKHPSRYYERGAFFNLFILCRCLHHLHFVRFHRLRCQSTRFSFRSLPLSLQDVFALLSHALRRVWEVCLS